MANVINFKMGMESNVPSAIKKGTVYFTTDNTFGKIWFDDQNGNKVNVVPDVVDGGAWGYAIIDSTCCFVADTAILLDFNGNTKPIQDIKAGDKVISYNIFKQEFYEVVVNQLIIHENTTDLAIVTFGDGRTLEMNEYHPLYTINGFHSITNYKGYDTLKVGDIVKSFDGWHEIINIERYKVDKPIITYNIGIKNFDEMVDDDTNDTFVANGFVAHNAPCMT